MLPFRRRNTSRKAARKANEADCGAQTPKSKHVRKGENCNICIEKPGKERGANLI